MISEEEWELFLEHCFNGNSSEVKEALNNHILENIRDSHYDEIVDYCERHIGRTWQLVKNRISRNIKFIDAIIKHDEESVKKFIKYNNIDINYLHFDDEDGDPKTPIRYIFNEDFICNINILQSLLNAKQRIIQEDIQLSLCYCAYTNSIEGVTLLLDYGADINYILESGERALGIAISDVNMEMAKFLVRKGAQIIPSDACSYIDLEELSREATGPREMREISLFEIDAFVDYLASQKYNEALEDFKGSLHEDEYEIIQIRAKKIHKHFLTTIAFNIEKLLTEKYALKIDKDKDSIGFIDSWFDPETTFQELTYSDLLGLDFDEYLNADSIHSDFRLEEYADGI